MKWLRYAAGLGTLVAVVAAKPEFVGMMVSQGMTYVAVREEEGARARWVKIGDDVGGYRVTSYDPVRETLQLRKADTELELTLKIAAVEPTPTRELLESLVKGDPELQYQLEALKYLADRLHRTDENIARALKDPTASETVGQLRRVRALDQRNLELFSQRLYEVARSRAKAGR